MEVYESMRTITAKSRPEPTARAILADLTRDGRSMVRVHSKTRALEVLEDVERRLPAGSTLAGGFVYDDAGFTMPVRIMSDDEMTGYVASVGTPPAGWAHPGMIVQDPTYAGGSVIVAPRHRRYNGGAAIP